jgi:hypothetical protein
MFLQDNKFLRNIFYISIIVAPTMVVLLYSDVGSELEIKSPVFITFVFFVFFTLISILTGFTERRAGEIEAKASKKNLIIHTVAAATILLGPILLGIMFKIFPFLPPTSGEAGLGLFILYFWANITILPIILVSFLISAGVIIFKSRKKSGYTT